MTIDRIDKGVKLLQDINDINRVITEDGTKLRKDTGSSYVYKVVMYVAPDEIIKVLREKRAELQQQFNDL